MDRFPRTAAIVVLALLLSAATLMAGCSQQQPLTVKITENPTYGKILTDSTGRSLYIQARDVPNTGAVANLGEVGRFYPPFYAESVTDGDGINISEFGHISRADGKQQTTFRGWPLYYYINDKASGEAKSQGANNITFLAKPDYTVMVRENVTLGIYLSDPSGAPLLVRDNDTSEGPAPDYLPFRVSTVVAPSPLVQSADFGEVTGPSGGSQTTFRGQRLYLFSGQDRPGTIAGIASGYHAVLIAQGGALTGTLEAPTDAPSPSATITVAGTAATAVPVTTTEATTATTRSGGDGYTGGAYTPTPFQTVAVIGQATESPTTTSNGTTIPTGGATLLPTVSAPSITLPPATTAGNLTTRVTTVRTTAPPAVKTPTPRPTTVRITTVTTRATTVPVPPTTPPTTIAPTSTRPTTLPLPFPITTPQQPNPAISTQSGNGS